MNATDYLMHKIETEIPKLNGWCSVERAKMLAKLVCDNSICTAVLIGVYGGRDTIAIAMAMKAMGAGTIHAVDPWSSEASANGMDGANKEWWGNLNHDPIYADFMSARKSLRLENHIIVYRKTNRQAYPILKDGRYQLLVIDGNHGAESVFDVEHYMPLLRPGGYVYADDVAWASDATKLLQQMNLTELLRIDTGILWRKES
jgi:hypothetical protein